MDRDQRPVIYLAFANPETDEQANLRHLPEEQRQLRAALEAAEDASLCRVFDSPSATFDELVHKLRRYREHLAIFHFAGHAGATRLLLEDKAGWSEGVHAAPLADLLGERPSLTLVFLNGCSTRPQVERLLRAGIPIVISTSEQIRDDAAAEFASVFYRTLGEGQPLHAAFREASATLRSRLGDDPKKYYRGKASPSELSDWPWHIDAAPGAQERLFRWSLPQAANDPLFGIPEPTATDLPPSPYKHLEWFTEKDTRIFFGRGQEIRQLYQAVTARDGTPVILLFGASGVGKSSLLAAGLLPRLEKKFTVHYLRRDGELGLNRTLAKPLEIQEISADFSAAWKEKDQNRDLPLLIVLDQLEEAWTRPLSLEESGDTEAEAFASTLEAIFRLPSNRPQGRLILGFRSEWLAPVLRALEDKHLPFERIEIHSLSTTAIEEIALGPASTEAHCRRYNLTVDPEVPKAIARDLAPWAQLSSGLGNVIAPMLQILLSKMWTEARERNLRSPNFKVELYKELRTEGLLLDDFLDSALTQLREQHPEASNSGLILDLLSHHTTSLGTAAVRNTQDIYQRYPSPERIPAILESCRSLHLITGTFQAAHSRDVSCKPPGINQSQSRLAHDTLAPLVRRRFNTSPLPGPRSHQLLTNKCNEWTSNNRRTVLSSIDLETIKKGLSGTCQPEHIGNGKAMVLLQTSRSFHKAKRARSLLLAIIAIITIILGIQIWTQQAIEAKTGHQSKLLTMAQNESKPGGNSELALAYLAAAQRQAPGDRVIQSLLTTQLENHNPIRLLKPRKYLTSASISHKWNRLIIADQDGIKSWSMTNASDRKDILPIKEPGTFFLLSHFGSFAIKQIRSTGRELWSTTQKAQLLPNKKYPESLSAIRISPDESIILSQNNKGETLIHRTHKGTILSSTPTRIELTGIRSAKFCVDGNCIVTQSSMNIIDVWTLNDDHNDYILTDTFPWNSGFFILEKSDSILLTKLGASNLIRDNKRQRTLPTELEGEVLAVVNPQNEQSFAITGTSNRLEIWTTTPFARIQTIDLTYPPNNINVSTKQRLIAVTSYTGAITFIDTRSWKIIRSPTSKGYTPTKIRWSPDDHGVLMYSAFDNDVYYWQINHLITGNEISLTRPPTPCNAIRQNLDLSERQCPTPSILDSPNTDKEQRAFFEPYPLPRLSTLSPDRTVVTIITKENRLIKSYYWRRMKHLGPPIETSASLVRVYIDPNNEVIKSVSTDLEIQSFLLKTGKSIHQPKKAKSLPKHIAINTLAGIGAYTVGNKVIIWDLASGEDIDQIDPPHNVTRLLFSPKSKYLAITTIRDDLYLYNRASQELNRLEGGTHSQIANIPRKLVSFSHDESTIAAVSRNIKPIQRAPLLHLWRTATSTKVGSIEIKSCSTVTITAVDSQNLSIGTTCPSDSELIAHNLRDKQTPAGNEYTTTTDLKIKTYPESKLEPTGFALSINGNILALALSDNSTKVWTLDTTPKDYEPIHHQHEVTHIQLSPDEEYLLSRYQNETVTLWDWRKRTIKLGPIPHSGYHDTAILNSRSTILYTSISPSISQAWEIDSGAYLGQPLSYSSYISRLLISSNTDLTITSSRDGVISAWHTNTGMPIGSINANNSAYRPHLTKDGSIVTNIFNGYGHYWKLPNLSNENALLLADLAEAIAGYRSNYKGSLSEIKSPAQEKLTLSTRERIERSTSNDLRMLNNWLSEHPWTRDTQPGSGISRTLYALQAPKFAKEWFPDHPIIKNCTSGIDTRTINSTDLDPRCVKRSLEEMRELNLITSEEIQVQLNELTAYQAAITS